MKKKNILLVGLVVVIITGVIISATILSKPQPSNEQETNPGSGGEFKAKSTGSTGPGDALVELTPLEFADGKLKVDIAVNTHSIELDQFDLKEITTLEYNGKVIKPEEALKLSGHHSFGVIVFSTADMPSEFTIKITGIPKVEERIFEWR